MSDEFKCQLCCVITESCRTSLCLAEPLLVCLCWWVGGTLTEVSHGPVSGCWLVAGLICCWTPVLFSGSPWSALCLSVNKDQHEITQSRTTDSMKPELLCTDSLSILGFNWHTFIWEPPWLWSYADGSAVLLVLWRPTQIIPHTFSTDPAQVGAFCLNALVHSLLLRWARNIRNH